jgi:two-component system OmpR family response regulator/two-component system response regulator QseB
MRILIVEDDAILAKGLEAALLQGGYATELAGDVGGAKIALKAEEFGLVLLDIGLPDASGLTLIHWIRRQTIRAGALRDTPVLIITARQSVDDRVEGLDSGADDYLVKPVDKRELLARIRVLARRAQGRSAPEITLGTLRIDPSLRTVSLAGTQIDLPQREFALLLELATKPGVVMSKAQLENALYGTGAEVESNTIEVHIHHLRKKLGDGLIRTLRGAGYCLTEPKP